jgi:hypothetical protein
MTVPARMQHEYHHEDEGARSVRDRGSVAIDLMSHSFGITRP